MIIIFIVDNKVIIILNQAVLNVELMNYNFEFQPRPPYFDLVPRLMKLKSGHARPRFREEGVVWS